MTETFEVDDISIKWELKDVQKEGNFLKQEYFAETKKGTEKFSVFNKEQLSSENAFQRVLEDTHYFVSCPDLFEFMNSMGIEDEEAGQEMYDAHKALMEKFQNIGVDEEKIFLLAEKLLGI